MNNCAKSTVDPKNKTEHNELLMYLSLVNNKEEKLIIKKKLDSMRDYEPRYKHSFIEDDKMVRFHPQAIADARTFYELAKSVFLCLRRNIEC